MREVQAGSKQAKIIKAIQNGFHKPEEIARKSRVKQTTTRASIGKLVNRGVLVMSRPYHYELSKGYKRYTRTGAFFRHHGKILLTATFIVWAVALSIMLLTAQLPLLLEYIIAGA